MRSGIKVVTLGDILERAELDKLNVPIRLLIPSAQWGDKTIFELPLAMLSAKAYRSKNGVSGVAVIKKLFEHIDHLSAEEVHAFNGKSRKIIKSTIMTAIAKYTVQSPVLAKEKDVHRLQPCFALEPKLASYISIDTPSHIWSYLDDARPSRDFGIKIDEDNYFQTVKAKLQQLLMQYYQGKPDEFLKGVKLHFRTHKDEAQYLNKLLAQCENIAQVKNLFCCAINQMNYVYSLDANKQYRKHGYYQTLLTGLHLADDFLHRRCCKNQTVNTPL